MTLDTRVYVLDEVDHREVFRECQRLIGQYATDRRGPDQQRWTDEQNKTWSKGESFVELGNPWTIGNDVGQGLPAWLLVYYRPAESYRSADQSAEHDEWTCNFPGAKHYEPDEPLCDETEHDQPCWLEISMDTAYGYRGPEGMGCGDLHARIVAELGQWLDAKGARWKWRNEFSGEIHEGYERLIDIASSGFEASAWFSTTVAPAIAAQIAKEAGR